MSVNAAPPAPHPLPPAAVIERYQYALEMLLPPPYQVFEFTVDQVGWNDIAQTHRIYRGRGFQRDELIADGGHAVKPPVVRIRRAARDRYAVSAVAPMPAGYTFMFAGVVRRGERLAYLFQTRPAGPAQAFVVRSVVIDGVSYLPSKITFATHAAKAAGSGTMLFAKSGSYWVATRVSVTSTVSGHQASESIVFSGYRFPKSLPTATFKTSHALSAASAAALSE
ncbi:hypothetical protein EPN52_02810 [bacterium]|nr:MAG: hypothetical protein EPN52_02810 [bacterium]